MIYVISGYSRFDYEIKGIIFGVFTDKINAETTKKQLEDKQKKNGANEMILSIEEYEINALIDKNIKNYLYL